MDSEDNPQIATSDVQTEKPFRIKHTNFLMIISLITIKNIICFLLNVTLN